jgi:O-antigen/teichoic acid export membrane protein
MPFVEISPGHPPPSRGTPLSIVPQPTSSGPGIGLVRNMLHLGVGQVTTTALTMVLNAVIARTLGAADFGLLYLLTSIANFAYVFVDWGHAFYVPREVARHPERSGELMGSVLAVRAVTAVLVGAIAVGLTSLFGYDVRTRLLTALIIVCWMPAYLALTYAWVFRGRERMDYDALLNIVLKACLLIVSVWLLLLGGRLIAFIGAWAVAGTVAYALAIRLYGRLHVQPLRVSGSTARELVSDGAPMLAFALAIAVQPYIDANILYKLVPASVVGWYGAAWIIAGTLIAPASILGSAMFPRLSRSWDRPEEFARSLRLAFRPLLLVAILGAVGTNLFADFAVALAYGARNFGPSAGILRAFAPALVLTYVDMLFGFAILAAGKAPQLAKAKVAAVIVTTAAELVLIPWAQHRFSNGGIGIMLAIAGGELVMVVAAILLIRRYVTPRMALDLVRGLLSGAATIALMRSIPTIHPIVGIPLCIAIFGAVSAATGLITRQDLEFLISAARRTPDPEA